MKKTKHRGINIRGDSIMIDIQVRGQRYRQTLRIPPTPHNIKYAKRYRDSLLFDIEVGKYKEHEKSVSLGTAVSYYLRDHRHQWKKSTYLGYSKIYYSREDLLDLDTKDIDTRWVLNWQQEEIARGTAPKTINNVHSLFRSSLSYAVELGKIDENPFAKVKFLSVPSEAVEPFSPKEIEILFASCEEPWETYYLALAVFTGMRTGELLALRWEYIDLEKGRIRVEKNYVAGECTSPKTAAGKREIPIFPILRPFLESEKKGRVLLSPDGKPWRDSNQVRKRLWLPLIARSQLGYRKPYSLRHTFASLALSAGEDPSQVAYWMGHADWAMIRKVYARWIPTASPVTPGSRLASVLDSRIDICGSLSGSGWQKEAYITDPKEVL